MKLFRYEGGSYYIMIGKKGNNSFGYSFEAKVYTSFIPLMILLRFYRINPPKPVLWKKAFIIDGVRYNIDMEELNQLILYKLHL